MRKYERGTSAASLLSLAAAVILALGAALWLRSSQHKVPTLDTQYQAVLLNNGSVFFGKLQGLGTPYPVLTEVYYVQSTTNPETKAVSNVLVKRGREWHGPDRMVINEKSIVFVEPVSPNSKVAELIAESKRKP